LLQRERLAKSQFEEVNMPGGGGTGP